MKVTCSLCEWSAEFDSTDRTTTMAIQTEFNQHEKRTHAPNGAFMKWESEVEKEQAS